jgi:hypothetical protein
MTRHYAAESEAIQVTVQLATPVAFRWRQRRYRVDHILCQWEVLTEWWEPHGPIHRRYYRLETSAGMLCEISCNLDSGAWFLERVFD